MGSSSAGGHLAVALAAGALATKKESGAAAIRDRYESLKRAIGRKSSKIDLQALADEPASEARRSALAKELDEHGASKNGDVITRARELLGLIKVDDGARDAVDAMFSEVEKALIALSEIDVEPEPPKEAEPKKAETKKAETKDATPKKTQEPKSKPKVAAATSSQRSVVQAPTTSRRLIPPDEHSKTELERSALPIWKRTDQFFMKAGILVASYVVLFGIYWVFIRTPPDDAMERCRNGEAARCWQVVATQDTVAHGTKVLPEPLMLLCQKHGDACACAGLTYLNAADSEHHAECDELAQASTLDPQWPCTCTHYAFWRNGQKRLTKCGIARCE